MGTMHKIRWTLAFMLVLVLVLAGCGKKDAGEVTGDLEDVLGKLVSYQAKGEMTLHTAQSPQAYTVEIWYQAPHYYRVALTNSGKDVTQIVLKNDDGVFVLTPQLNKSFRFTSTWPEQHGQAYMFHTLIESIIADKDRQFAQEDDAYVFDVVSNLQNRSLKRQRIWLNKDDYAPIRMEAMDENARVLLDMKFDSFRFNTRFEDDSFQMERNMTGYELRSVTAVMEEAEETSAAKPSSFGVIYPAYLPDGVVLKDMSDIQMGDDQGVLLRYEGTYPFTLTEIRPRDRAVTAASGTVVDLDLGFAVGVLLEGDNWQTLTWIHDGVEFRLASADLPYGEMVNIAQSMEMAIGK